MQKHILMLTFMFIFISADAQNTDTHNRRELLPWGVSLNLLGPTGISSVNVDYFFSRHISIEAGAGFFGAYIGGKAYIGKKQWSGMPYVGYTAAMFGFPGQDDDGVYLYNYLPVGYHYVSKGGFNIAIEAAFNPDDGLNELYGQLRLGYRFKKKTKK
jgi:hypothetical protein